MTTTTHALPALAVGSIRAVTANATDADQLRYAETVGMVLGVLLLPFLLIAALAGAMPEAQQVASTKHRFARSRNGKVKKWKRKR